MAAKVAITGNLTKDPEMKTYGGKPACVFSVATRTRSKDTEGNYKTNFYNCTWFGSFAQGFCSRAQKGTGVTVWGDLTAEIYGGNGDPRLSLNVNVDSVEAQARLREGGAASAPAAPASDDTVVPF